MFNQYSCLDLSQQCLTSGKSVPNTITNTTKDTVHTSPNFSSTNPTCRVLNSITKPIRNGGHAISNSLANPLKNKISGPSSQVSSCSQDVT
jgi:hypothetical protein